MTERGESRATYAAEFADEGRLVEAINALALPSDAHVEVYSPYPVPGAEPSPEASWTPLPVLAFVAGAGGAAVAYWVQWYANAVSYPLNIGGRPAHATGAFMIPTFEGTVLIASLTVFAMLLVLLRFPRPWHPIFEVTGFERASIDRFWIAVSVPDGDEAADRIRRDLAALAPLRVVRVVEDP